MRLVYFSWMTSFKKTSVDILIYSYSSIDPSYLLPLYQNKVEMQEVDFSVHAMKQVSLTSNVVISVFGLRDF